jgi:toxin ParE1/3/4
MVENERKEVKVSGQFDLDISNIFLYGEETFGYVAAKSFIADIYSRVWSLDTMYLIHSECRYLPTKSKMYRNIILGSYLIIYRITAERIEVLSALHGSRFTSSSARTIRKIKI